MRADARAFPLSLRIARARVFPTTPVAKCIAKRLGVIILMVTTLKRTGEWGRRGLGRTPSLLLIRTRSFNPLFSHIREKKNGGKKSHFRFVIDFFATAMTGSAAPTEISLRTVVASVIGVRV